MRNTICQFAAALALALAAAMPARAMDFIQTNRFNLGAGEVLDKELWLSAESAAFLGEARNDLFLMVSSGAWGGLNPEDGRLTLAGRLENDVWALAGNIDLSGSACDHARLMAKSIVISGSVSNSAILAGNSIHLTAASSMGRDVMIFGENVIVEGNVDGNLTVFAKSATLDGQCSGNARITAGDIVVLPRARVAGDLVYTSPAELVPDKEAVVGGRLVRVAEEVSEAGPRPLVSWPSIILQSWLLAGALCVAALMLFLFPAFMHESASQLKLSAWKALAVGFVAACLVPFACFFLAISIVGLPLAALAAMAFMVMAYLAKVAVALFLGSLLIRPETRGIRALPAAGLGLLLLYAAAGSGLAGNIVSFLIVCLGLGGFIMAAFARRAAARAPTPPA